MSNKSHEHIHSPIPMVVTITISYPVARKWCEALESTIGSGALTDPNTLRILREIHTKIVKSNESTRKLDRK